MPNAKLRAMAALIVFVLSQRSEENLHRDFRPDRHPYTPDPLRFSTRGAASHLSSELGFSKELHELNIRGFVLAHVESVCVSRARMVCFAAKVSRSGVQLNTETALGMGDQGLRVVS